MKRIMTVFLLGVMATTALGLYKIKHQGARLEAENNRLRAEIASKRSEIDVLKAEWSHLNDPARIQDLASRHLSLGRPEMGQFAQIGDIPMRELPAAPLDKAQLDMLIEDAVTMTGSIKVRRPKQ